MAGETNLNKLKEVAEYFYNNRGDKNVTGHFYSPSAIKRIHEFLNDGPDIIMSEDLHYITDANADKEWHK